MKIHFVATLMAISPALCFGQHTFYKSGGVSEDFERVYNEIAILRDSKSGGLDKIDEIATVGGILAVAGPLINLGFALFATTAEEKMLAYKKSLSCTVVDPRPVRSVIPTLKFSRRAYKSYDNQVKKEVTPIFSFALKPRPADTVFYYELDSLKFSWSDAKLKKKHNTIDWTCEIQIVGVGKDGKVNTYSGGIFSVLYLSTEDRESTDYKEPIYTKTTSSLMPRDIAILEVKMSITETNSAEIPYDAFITKALTTGEQISALLSTISENIK